MPVPQGYSKIGVIGYADKGAYDATVTYNKYQTVQYDGSTWVCLVDNTVGVTPAEGTTWHYIARGYSQVDDEVSTSSTHPVENQAITNYVNGLATEYNSATHRLEINL